MIIKSGPCRKIILPTLVIFEIIILVVCIINEIEKVDRVIIIIIWSFLVLIDIWAILDAIIALRTIIMDRDGCTVCLFNYRRHFKWDEITVKRLESGYRRLIGKDPMQGVYFSIKESKKSIRRDPYWYGMFKNPFQHFFVYITDLDEEKFIMYNPSYTLMKNRLDFMKKISEWGVELSVE